MVGASGIVANVDGVLLDGHELISLFADNLGDLLEEDVEITHALLDVPDLVLALGDEGVLEVDLVLGDKVDLLLLLQLELLAVVAGGAGLSGRLVVEGGAGGGDGGTLFLEGRALEGLEIGEGRLQLARELLLGVLLRGLSHPQRTRVSQPTTDGGAQAHLMTAQRSLPSHRSRPGSS